MTDKPSPARAAGRLIILGIALLVVAVFALVFVAMTSRSEPGAGEINAESYAEEVAAALANADSEIGGDLVYELECNLCHLRGDGSQSPLFYGLADIASQRRPPLSAEQYLYEATLYPGIHLVEGYSNAMPNNYDERLTRQQVGHIIAYLLTFSDE
jgi:cytochrome c5